MALITCRNCGKNISDTTDHCIHCGAPTKETYFENQTFESTTYQENYQQDNTQYYQQDTQPKPKISLFDNFSDNKKADLESEFLKSNAQIMKYRRKGVEKRTFGLMFCYMCVLIMTCGILPKILANKFYDGVIYKPEFIEYSVYFIFGFAVVALVSLIASIYSAISYNDKVKKAAYQKFFQEWLAKEKNITYYPNFIKIEEQQLFDQIDTRTFTF